VAAFAATALPFPAQAYCRGCVVEAKVPTLASAARAEAPADVVKTRKVRSATAKRGSPLARE
jgi:hypothetical protein